MNYRPAPTDPWANFWKRVKERPLGDIVRETAPPTPGKPREIPEHITPEALAACLTESDEYNRARSRADMQKRAQRAATARTAASVTTRSTAIAERLLGIK